MPFYRQHFDYTCGPASLMMAMKHFTDIPLTEALEVEIWREANMVEVYGTSRYGLAYSAVKRGFCAAVTSSTGGVDFVDRIEPPIEGLNVKVLRLHFEERQARCLELGVKDSRRAVTPQNVYEALRLNRIPLIVTNALHCQEGEDIPHWVTVTGIDQDYLYFNNPLNAQPQESKFELSDFSLVVGYKGDQSMVEVWKPQVAAVCD